MKNGGYTAVPHLSEIWIVWLVLLGHEEEEDPIEELEPVQGGDAHVQEHTVQHRHRDLSKHN